MNFAEMMKANADATGMKAVQGSSPNSTEGESVKGDMSTLGDLMKAQKVDKPLNNVQPSGDPRVAKRGAPAVGEHFDTGLIATWSFSGLVNHERCPWFLNLHKVQKVPQESGEAAQRGSVIHDQCELWVRGEVDELPRDKKTKMDAFVNDFDQLKAEFNAGKASLEDEWGCRKDWTPCDWDDDELWGKAKLDAFIMEDETSCRIIDYKTGRRYGNEMKHKDQGVTYALHAFHRYPDLDHFQIEFWYLDQGTKMVFSYGRPHLAIFLPLWHERAYQMTTDEDLLPTPNVNNCIYCSYGCNTNKAGTKTYGNGECEFDFYRRREEIA